jgi:hypothetical protein
MDRFNYRGISFTDLALDVKLGAGNGVFRSIFASKEEDGMRRTHRRTGSHIGHGQIKKQPLVLGQINASSGHCSSQLASNSWSR